MKNNYTFAVILPLLLLGSQAIAQSNLGLKKNTVVSTSPSQNVASNNDGKVKRYDQSSPSNSVLPAESQIHSPYRWYAIENEQNPLYWESVNTQRAWVELEMGRSIQDSEIAEFLNAFGLTKLIREKSLKDKTNYWIFENANTTPAQFVSMAKAAAEIDGILFLEPSITYTQSYIPNDPLYEYQWGPYASYFDEAWDYGRGGNSLNVVAVIDGACDWNHEDLFDQVWYGYDYADDDVNISPSVPTELHGTHVTGTVAATIGNGIGVSGMVNDTVYFAKVGVDGEEGLPDYAIVNALNNIASIDRITVVNMSLGSDVPSSAIEQACNLAWNNGKLLIVASGNNGQGFVGFPAAFPACVAIGSIGTDGNNLYLTNYSQYGPEQELCAAGGDLATGFGIVSTIPNNEYDAIEGTSMAAPHVTGLAGLMKNLNPNLSNVDIRNILAGTAFDMGNTGWDQLYGYGLINALGAVQAAVNSSGISDRRDNTIFELYPNPAVDQLNIQLKTEMNRADVEVFDITGQRVHVISNASKSRITVDVSNLSSGVYIVSLRSENGLSTARFVKQ